MAHIYDFIVGFLFNEFEERVINKLPNRWSRLCARVLLGAIYILVLFVIVWFAFKVFKIL